MQNITQAQSSHMRRARPFTVRHVALAAAALLATTSSPTQADTFAPGACVQVPNSQTCVDAVPCKTDASGFQICLASVAQPPAGSYVVPESCWQWTYQYACSSSAYNGCAPYEHISACSVLGSTCQDVQQPSGNCDSWTFTYRCQTAPAQAEQQTVCTNGLFDSSGFAAMPKANDHMPQAAVAEEMIRQGQVYTDHGSNLFAGVSEYCKKGYGGIKSCCGSSPGAQANSQISQVAFGAAAQAAKYAGEQAIDWASPYVFDAMYNNGIWSEGLASAFSTGEDTFGTSLASSGFSVGAYGFTYSSASTAGGGLLGGNTEIMSFGENGADGFIEFNPYVFAAVVIITVVENLASCTPQEQLLSQHKGANLSVYEDTSCVRSFAGACLEHQDRYCSFNSVLAKIVQTQGKAQLGLSTSDCSGLTLQEVSQIDFSRIDFSQFTQSMTDQALRNSPTSAAIANAYKPIMSGKTGGSAQTRTLDTATSVVGAASQPTLPLNPVLPQYPASAPGP